jgi:hypothetical protein
MRSKSNKARSIEEDVKRSLSKYKGENVERVLKNIRDDIQEIMDSYVGDGMYVNDFPIEFENDLGKFRIQSNGESYFFPKTGVQHIEINMTILPSGEIYDGSN